MKIISWNVNGIRAAMKKGFAEILKELDADIFCLQETKAQDDQVLEALSEISDYQILVNSAEKKGYSGTAILTRHSPVGQAEDIGVDSHDTEGRVVRADFDSFSLVNVYVPNSGSGLKRLDYRAEWDRAFANYLHSANQKNPTIVTGDFNVAHEAIDLARPKENYDKTSGYTQVEIDGLDEILNKGFTDAFRHLYPEKVQYTFWNQRFGARARNVGWRIDYFLVPDTLVGRVKDCYILDQIEGSDHCPIGLEISL